MRVKLQFPEQVLFRCRIAVRISDINYGGHLGNDRLIGILHETRMQFLQQYRLTELNIGECGLIMADLAVQYQGEAFYGDTLSVELGVDHISNRSFDFMYRLEVERNGEKKPIALAKTAMVCFDYKNRSICTMPANFRARLGSEIH